MGLRRPARAELSTIRERLRESEQILFALDFDGTLAPIAARPEDAVLPAATARTLRRIASSDHMTAAVFSGRSIPDLKSKVAVDCILAGNHGLEIEGGGIAFLHKDAALIRYAVECFCADVEVMLAGVPSISLERKGLTATIHYRMAPPDLAEWIEATIGLAVRPYGSLLRARQALAAWEILPGVDWNKGMALNLVLEQLGARQPLVVCAGDDTTDEDMFRACADAISIRVGTSGDTAAQYCVENPAELAALLTVLADGSFE